MPKFYDYQYNGIKVRATRRRPSSRDDKKYMRDVVHDGNERIVHYGDPDMEMQRDNPERRENFLARHSCDTKRDPFAPGFWACYDWYNTEEKSMELDEENNEVDNSEQNTQEQETPPADDTTTTGDVATEALFIFGEQVKAVGGGVVEALGIRYGNPEELDLQEDYFTAKTFLGHTEGDGAEATLNHRQPIVTKNEKSNDDLRRLAPRPFKNPVKTFRTDKGLIARHVLELADEYEKWVYDMVEQGAFRWSSGSASHVVERDRKTGEIKRWPIVEFAYTPTAAEPRLPKITPVKSLENLLLNIPQEREAEAEVDEAKSTDHKQSEAVIVILDNDKEQPNNQENNNMADNEDVKSLQKQVADLTGLLTPLLEAAEKNRRLADAGLIADQDTTNNATKTSFTDWLLALKNGNFERLRKVYGSRPNARDTKGMEVDNGATGAWLLPTEFGLDLINTAFKASPVLSRVTRIPVNSDNGRYPAFDITRTPTAGAGNDPMAAGLTSAIRQPGASYNDASAYVSQILFQIRYEGGIVKVDNELIASSPLAIETALRNLINIQVYSKIERNVLRGSGVGEALGILTDTNTLVLHTPGTNNLFSASDAATMLSRLLIMNPANVAWIMHPGTLPDLATMQVSTGSSVGYMQNLNQGMTTPLFSYPVFTSVHLPQDDNSGNVILCDLSAYGLFIQEEVALSFSEHAYFSTGQSAWRFETRYDGRPLTTGVYTLPDPQGSFTQSYAVSHND